MLRLAPEDHARLRTAAAAAGLSLNEYCVRRLGARGRTPDSIGDASACVERALELFGDDVLAVIAYGSWSRGEATAISDLDLLVVLARSAITRELYRRWDSGPLTIDGHAVEPHFVRLRDPAEPPTGLWIEAAIDGIVLFERGLEVSRRLSRIRRDVIAGRLVRRTVHGQPYWTQVA